jgi:simple sugar transport system ATP-binding protein
MNVCGLYQPDEGQISINGQPTHIASPHDAIAQGIGMVHQHFMLIPPLTVAENIMLGQESIVESTRALKSVSVLDRRSVSKRIRELSQQYGLAVDPDAYVRDLAVGEQQRVEIVKALYRSADILILDEPTAVLTPQEADDLFVIMRSSIGQGKSIVFITHKLVKYSPCPIASALCAAADGRLWLTWAEATSEMLAEMMVGRKVILSIDKEEAHPQEPILRGKICA